MSDLLKVLLIGANGQVSTELQRRLAGKVQLSVLGSAVLDLTDPSAIREQVRAYQPGLIINPAAHTAVDKAESEPELALAINATAPGVLAEEAARIGAPLIHYSTDYVFDGSKPGPYVETDPTAPWVSMGKASWPANRPSRRWGRAPYLAHQLGLCRSWP